MSRQSLGDLLAMRRKAKGMNQAQLAGKMGVTQSRISQIERGDPIPRTLLDPLIRELEIGPHELMAYLVDIFDPVESAIMESSLNRKDQDTMLAVYGQLAGRNSVDNANNHRTLGENWDQQREDETRQ